MTQAYFDFDGHHRTAPSARTTDPETNHTAASRVAPNSDFSADQGALARDAAIDRVEANAMIAWKDAALTAVKHAAQNRREFTTDQIWALIPRDVGTHEPRALGAVMRIAAKMGWIEPTDRHLASCKVAAHRRPMRVWRSRIFASG